MMTDGETRILNSLHDKLLMSWEGGGAVKPLFFYAMDPSYLSEEAYHIIGEHAEEIAQWTARRDSAQLKYKALALILYHIRRFFEEGNGGDYWDCLPVQGARTSSFGLLLGVGNGGEIMNSYDAVLFNDTLLKELGTHDEQIGREAYDFHTWFSYHCPFLSEKSLSQRLSHNNTLIFSDALRPFIECPWDELLTSESHADEICREAAKQFIEENRESADEHKEDGSLDLLGFDTSYIHALLKYVPVDFLLGLKSLIADQNDTTYKEEAVARWPWLAPLWGKGEREYAYWTLRESHEEQCCYLSVRKTKVAGATQQIGLYQIQENEMWGAVTPGMKEKDSLKPAGTVFCRIRRKDCRILDNGETRPLPGAIYILLPANTPVSLRRKDGEEVLHRKQKLNLFRAKGDEEKLNGYDIIKLDLTPLFHAGEEEKEMHLQLQIGTEAKAHEYTFRRSATLQMEDDCLAEVVCRDCPDCAIIQGTSLSLSALINAEGLEIPRGLSIGAEHLRLNDKALVGAPLTLKNRFGYCLRIMFLPHDWQSYAVYGEVNDVMCNGQQAYNIPLPSGEILRLVGDLRHPQACWDRRNTGTISRFAELQCLHLLQFFPQEARPVPFVRILIEGVVAACFPLKETRTPAEYLLSDLNGYLYPGCRLEIAYNTPDGRMHYLFSGLFEPEDMDYLYSRHNILHTECLRPTSRLEIKSFQFAEEAEQAYCLRIAGQWHTAPQGIPVWIEAEVDSQGFRHQASGWLPNGFPHAEALQDIRPEQTDRLERLLHPVRFSKEEDFLLQTENPQADVFITMEHESGRRETISSATDLEWVMDREAYIASLTDAMQILELPQGWYRMSFSNGKQPVFSFYGQQWQTPTLQEGASQEWTEVGTFLLHHDAVSTTDMLKDIAFPEQAARNGVYAEPLPLHGIFRVAGLQMPIYAVRYACGKYYLRDEQAQETAETQSILDVPRNKIWAAHLIPAHDGHVEIRPNADVSSLAIALSEQLPPTPRPRYSFGLFETQQARLLLDCFPKTAANAAVKGILRTWHRQRSVIPARLLLFFAIAYAYQQLGENRRKRLKNNLCNTPSLSAYFSFLVGSENRYLQQYPEVHEKLRCFTAWFYDWFNF